MPATINTRITLTKRHEKLIELFVKHPELVRSYALNANTRAFMMKADSSYAALIEQDEPLTGELTSAVADDFVHHTSSKHYSLHTWTGDRDLSFMTTSADLNHLVNHKITVTGLSLPEVVAVENVRIATPTESAAEVATHTALVLPQAAPTAMPLPSTGVGVPAGSSTALNSPLRNQTVATLTLKFTGSTAVYPAGGYDTQAFWNPDWNGPATPNVNEYTKEISYNQTSVGEDAYGPITVPGNFMCNDTGPMATAAIAAAVAAGFDVSKYNHFQFVYPINACAFGGLADLGGQTPNALIPHQYGYIWTPIVPYYSQVPSAEGLWRGASQHDSDTTSSRIITTAWTSEPAGVSRRLHPYRIHPVLPAQFPLAGVPGSRRRRTPQTSPSS